MKLSKGLEQVATTLGFGKQKFPLFSEFFNGILGSIRDPLVLIDSNLNIIKANQAFYLTFKVKPEETEGMLIFDIGNQQWKGVYLRMLKMSLPKASTNAVVSRLCRKIRSSFLYS